MELKKLNSLVELFFKKSREKKFVSRSPFLKWLKDGAIPSDSVKSLFKRIGLSYKWHLMNEGKSEQEIKTAIERIAHKTTTLVIAHRLSTIINSDKICVIENGRIVESGNYEYLISLGVIFNKMAKAQEFVT